MALHDSFPGSSKCFDSTCHYRKLVALGIDFQKCWREAIRVKRLDFYRIHIVRLTSGKERVNFKKGIASI